MRTPLSFLRAALGHAIGRKARPRPDRSAGSKRSPDEPTGPTSGRPEDKLPEIRGDSTTAAPHCASLMRATCSQKCEQYPGAACNVRAGSHVYRGEAKFFQKAKR